MYSRVGQGAVSDQQPGSRGRLGAPASHSRDASPSEGGHRVERFYCSPSSDHTEKCPESVMDPYKKSPAVSCQKEWMSWMLQVNFCPLYHTENYFRTIDNSAQFQVVILCCSFANVVSIVTPGVSPENCMVSDRNTVLTNLLFYHGMEHERF